MLRWDPCRGVAVRVALDEAPIGALADVKQAIAAVNAASGLRLRYAGATRTIPNRRNWLGSAGITLAWASDAQSDKLTGSNAGEGGNYAATTGTRWRVTHGFVVLDTRYNRLRPGFGSGGTRGALLIHELGHAVGLNHVKDSRQIMYPTITTKAAVWGSGDRTGLARVGRSGGCIH